MTEEVGAWAPLDGSTAGSGSIGGWSVLAATNRCKLVCTGETRRTPSSACIAQSSVLELLGPRRGRYIATEAKFFAEHSPR